jgi:hypothetical protein
MTTKTCSGCGAEIVWFLTAAGKRMPADAKPEKRIIIVGETEGMPMCQVVDAYMPHWATCKAAERFKKIDPAPSGE